MDDLIEHANSKHISLSVTHDVIKPGWVGANNGLLQILWERGYVDVEKYRGYALDGKKSWQDEAGKIREGYLPFCLRYVTSNCADFKNEKSANGGSV